MQTFEKLNVYTGIVPARTIAQPTADELAVSALPGLTAWYEADDAAESRWQFGTAAYPSNPDEAALQAQFYWLARIDGPAPSDPAKKARAGKAWCKTAAPRANADERPILMPAATPTGRAALRIGHDADGGQVNLTQDEHSGALETDQGGMLAASSYFVAWVGRIAAAQTGDCVLLGNCRKGSEQAFQVMINTTSGGQFKIRHRSLTSVLTVNSAFTVGTFQLFTLGWDSVSQKVILRRNGSQIGQATGVSTSLIVTELGSDLSIGAGGSENAQSSARVDLAAIWAGTVNLTDPAYAAELAALENYAMSEFITP